MAPLWPGSMTTTLPPPIVPGAWAGRAAGSGAGAGCSVGSEDCAGSAVITGAGAGSGLGVGVSVGETGRTSGTDPDNSGTMSGPDDAADINVGVGALAGGVVWFDGAVQAAISTEQANIAAKPPLLTSANGRRVLILSTLPSAVRCFGNTATPGCSDGPSTAVAHYCCGGSAGQ